MDLHGFYTGEIFDLHHFLGVHKMPEGYIFRIYAPHARRVTLAGEFTDWQDWEMYPCLNGHFQEVVVPQAREGQRYLYRIHHDGGCTEHCDPFGFGMDLRPAFCSIIRDMGSYTFGDAAWMAQRSDCRDRPLHIYELHCGSWKRHKDGSWLNYEELAQELIPYVKDMGYTHVELMPIAEHPCDESWGYQNTGFFAPTSRYGTMQQLKRFIDLCHQSGIGVLLDFVPVHFAVDSYGLAKFDGSPLYEYPNDVVGISEWGSCNFMHSRGEVRSFLQSSACWWLEEFHFDGLRMDAISRIIYWHGQPERGVNNQAVDFVRTMNRGLKERFPGCILCAEDSTNFSGVTRPAAQGGLGFDYKWDMGYMNDTLDYFRTAPEYRVRDYHKLTFSMMYHYGERYLLPFSHDENVHGKATILQKMSGQYEDKFPQARALYMYSIFHPGKLLDFMGSEFGQLREWDEHREQDWFLLEYPIHDAFHRYIRKLNQLYLAHPALYQRDGDPEGFRWLDCNQDFPAVYAMERFGGSEILAAVFNFGDKPQKAYTLRCDAARLRVLLDSSAETYSGCRPDTAGKLLKGKDGVFTMELPPYSGICFAAEK